mmetsp:Transcript_4789/g.15028  ORF Transcript_4789/g.15028 Transcript_4789/m.15028 type:complete len:236 (-) Transcript_4789:1119-1826(-)
MAWLTPRLPCFARSAMVRIQSKSVWLFARAGSNSHLVSQSRCAGLKALLWGAHVAAINARSRALCRSMRAIQRKTDVDATLEKALTARGAFSGQCNNPGSGNVWRSQSSPWQLSCTSTRGCGDPALPIRQCPVPFEYTSQPPPHAAEQTRSGGAAPPGDRPGAARAASASRTSGRGHARWRRCGTQKLHAAAAPAPRRLAGRGSAPVMRRNACTRGLTESRELFSARQEDRLRKR